MKKTLRIILALTLVIAALSVSVSAAGTNGFYDIDTSNENVAISVYAGADKTAVSSTEADVDADDAAEVYYEGSDRLGVTYSAATSGANYGVILVEGTALPTASSTIHYINQVQADDANIEFDVYPSDIAANTAMKLYISSSVEDEDLVEVPMAYVVGYEEVVEPEVIYGDVNNDTNVNVADRVYLMRHFGKWADYATLPAPDNADVDASGAVNVKDRLVLMRHFGKWSGYETLPVTDK